MFKLINSFAEDVAFMSAVIYIGGYFMSLLVKYFGRHRERFDTWFWSGVFCVSYIVESLEHVFALSDYALSTGFIILLLAGFYSRPSIVAMTLAATSAVELVIIPLIFGSGIDFPGRLVINLTAAVAGLTVSRLNLKLHSFGGTFLATSILVPVGVVFYRTTGLLDPFFINGKMEGLVYLTLLCIAGIFAMAIAFNHLREYHWKHEVLLSFINNSPARIIVLDSRGEAVLSNDRFKRAVLRHSDCDESITGYMNAGASSLLKTILTGEGSQEVVSVKDENTGNEHKLLLYSSPLTLPLGERGAVGFALDISEKIRLEGELASRDNMLRKLFADNKWAMMLVDAECKVVDYNEQMKYCLVDPSGLVRDQVARFVEIPVAESLTRRQSMHNCYFATRGSRTVHYEAVCSPYTDSDGNNAGAVCVVTEVSMERARLENIRQAFLNNPEIGVVTLDSSGRILDANQLYCQMLGQKSASQVLGKHIQELFASDYVPLTSVVLKTGKSSFVRKRFRLRSGECLYAEIFATPIFDGGGVLLGSIGILRDLSRELDLEAKLEELNAIKRALFEIDGACLLLVGRDENILDLNPSAASVLGLEREALTGSHCSLAVSESHLSIIREVFSTQTAITREFSDVMKNGVQIDSRVIAVPIKIEGKVTAVLTLGMDIRKEKALEKHFAYLDRLGLVGEMAAKIVHEMRSPITAAICSAQLIEQIGAKSEIRQLSSNIVESLSNAAGFLSDLLAMSKPGDNVMETGNIADTVRSTVNLLTGRLMRENIRFKLNIRENLPEVKFNQKLVRQALMNVIGNSIEALKDSAAPKIVIDVAAEESRVVVAVKDNGPGMDDGLKSKIFEPFFTTKSGGTGLGMAVTYQIMTQYHNGSIWVETEPGKGTTFYLAFPVEGVENGGHMMIGA